MTAIRLFIDFGSTFTKVVAMDLDEAVMQMDLANDHFLVFTNSRTDKVNVLYRRRDGHYGLIEPSS